MKAIPGPLPTGETWRYEPKWDGHRALVRRRDGETSVVSSSGADRNAAWSWLVDAIAEQVSTNVVLDGEVIAIADDGRHHFGQVGAAGVPHAFVVFDVLAHARHSLLDVPWAERRELLEGLVQPGPMLIVTPMTDDGEALWEATASRSFEGVVAKRTTSRYVPGRRTRDWVKAKHRLEDEFLVVGWLPRTGSSHRPGSLLLGVHDGGAIRFVGAAGSGLTDAMIDRLAPELRSLATEAPGRAIDVPSAVAAAARWVTPALVVQIRYDGWTLGRRLRHAVVLGQRDDVDPATVSMPT